MTGYLRHRAGAWRLRVDAGPDPITGKRRHVYRTVAGPDTRTGERAARRELAKLVTEVDAGRTVPCAGTTMAGLLERYIQHRAPSWSPGAADETRARIARHLAPRIGTIAVDRLRPVDLDHLYTRLRAEGLGPSSVARLHDILRAALRQAVRWDLITSSPADRIDPPRRSRSEIVPPSSADVTRLLDAADPTLRLYIRLSAVTGARRGQVCALRWTDVDLDAGEIRWTRALAKVKGGAVEKGTKTGLRHPVALDPATIVELRDHRIRQAESSLAVGAPLVDDAHLFSRDPAGRQPWHPDGATQRFAALRRRLDLEHVRLHDLRHWMATRLLADGYDIGTLAGRGGWANTTTPLEVYSHFQPARDRQAADHLGQALDGP